MRKKTCERRLLRIIATSRLEVIHNNLTAALEATHITSSARGGGSRTLNAQAKAAARSAFESAKQRFFDHASYCSPVAPGLFEEARFSAGDLNVEAFSPSRGDERSLQLRFCRTEVVRRVGIDGARCPGHDVLRPHRRAGDAKIP